MNEEHKNTIEERIKAWNVTYSYRIESGKTTLKDQDAYDVTFFKPSPENPVPIHNAHVLFFIAKADGALTFRPIHQRYRHSLTALPEDFAFDGLIDTIIKQKEDLDKSIGPLQSNLTIFRNKERG
ncbi:A-kinase anchor protein 28kDa [Carpediemonas membranifera]|uniref:A-kinase anchor protein 28kDa n=1 Tax=Carpediemonas membranifera TaxID=201153 RepID=A0A8J6AZF0_9EUKA|nr:A-kinase anchor protein 28kDa [Carpediemonas membranifera]|eukprot:KAG9396050.1 A-kinase anchor protein 28kDa [Carpediemonas membranifera]